MARDREQNGQHAESGEVFDRQYQVYKGSYEQRGRSEAEAEDEPAEKLGTGRGEPGGSHRDRD